MATENLSEEPFLIGKMINCQRVRDEQNMTRSPMTSWATPVNLVRVVAIGKLGTQLLQVA